MSIWRRIGNSVPKIPCFKDANAKKDAKKKTVWDSMYLTKKLLLFLNLSHIS